MAQSRDADIEKGQSLLEKNEEAKSAGTYCNRHIGSPAISAFGKYTGMVGSALLIGTSLPVSLVIGLPFAAANFVVEYHFVTLSALSAQDMHEKTVDAPPTLYDEGKAAIVLASSIAESSIEALKTFLRTFNLYLAFPASHLELISHFEAHGEKWFAEDGKNINATLCGKAIQVIALDQAWLRKNVIDVRATYASLLPTYYATIQMMSVVTLNYLFNYPVPRLVALSCGLLSAFSTKLIQTNYAQPIMKHNLALEDDEHRYMAWLIHKVAMGIEKAGNIFYEMPSELLSIVFTPKAVMWASNTISGITSGISTVKGGIQNLTQNKTSFLLKIPLWVREYVGGGIGAIGFTWGQTSQMVAAQEHTLDGEKIGVAAAFNKKFDTPERDTFSIKALCSRGSAYFGGIFSRSNSQAEEKNYQAVVNNPTKSQAPS